MFNVDTLQYDPDLVPFPAIAFCPVQALDEMNVVAKALNQVFHS